MKKLLFICLLPFMFLLVCLSTVMIVTSKLLSILCSLLMFKTGKFYCDIAIHSAFHGVMDVFDYADVLLDAIPPSNLVAKEARAKNGIKTLISDIGPHVNKEAAEKGYDEFAVSFFDEQWKHQATLMLFAENKTHAVECARVEVSKYIDLKKTPNIEAEKV